MTGLPASLAADILDQRRRCNVPECTRVHVARGYCALHYRRVRKHGSPASPTPTLSKRLLSKVDRDGPILVQSGTSGPCWMWVGSRCRVGYGWFSISGRQKRAHRVVYELLVGPIPDGRTIDHLCRNPSCVNPEHLEAVTPYENFIRGFSPPARNTRKTHCPEGHPLSSDNLIDGAARRGKRSCKTCVRRANREAARRRRQREAAANGHPNGASS